MRGEKQFSNGLKGYVILETTLLICIKIVECFQLQWWMVNVLEYAAILLNTLLVFRYYHRYGRKPENRSVRLIPWGLFATALADFFLTFISIERVYFPGILSFCIAQIIYTVWINPNGKQIVAQGILFAAGIFVAFSRGVLNAVAAVGILDISLLLINVLMVCTTARKKTPVLFGIGITLFLCCDVSICVRVLTTGILHEAAAFLVWIFYLPSQVCITLSYIRSLKTGE